MLFFQPDKTLTQAACRNVSELEKSYFFPNAGSSVHKMAKKICNSCPVKGYCLAKALEFEADGETMEGIWGGTTVRERRNLLKGISTAA